MPGDRDVPITIYLPPHAYRRILQLATEQETQAHTLIEHAVLRGLEGKKKPPRRAYKRLTDEDRATILDLTEKGWTMDRISALIGCSTSSVRNERRRTEVRGPNSPLVAA